MTVTIQTEHLPYCVNWHLVSDKYGQFYLGDYGKVCTRMMGFATCREAIAQACYNLGRPPQHPMVWDSEAAGEFAAMVLEALDIDEDTLGELDPWSLALH